MMRTVRELLLVFLVVLAVSPVPAAAPDGQKVVDGLAEVLRDMRDVTADVEIHTRNRQASGSIVLQYVRTPGEGPDDPERTVRKYIVVTRVRTRDGLAAIKQVNDGRYLWVERSIAATGEVKVIRRRVSTEGPVPGGFGPDWRKEADVWRRKFDFTTLRDDTFDEEPVTVVEGTRKEPGRDEDAEKHPGLSLPDRMVLFVSRRDRFPRKVELFSKKAEAEANGVLTVSVRLMHVKLNKGLAPDTFDYTVPPGAEFVDVK
ncbi:MAG TPA: hypothetical protein VMZ92_08405 [Planctomycetota bacterium]|nr:hypothetical protein [Planctomycetota bacterium]